MKKKVCFISPHKLNLLWGFPAFLKDKKCGRKRWWTTWKPSQTVEKNLRLVMQIKAWLLLRPLPPAGREAAVRELQTLICLLDISAWRANRHCRQNS